MRGHAHWPDDRVVLVGIFESREVRQLRSEVRRLTALVDLLLEEQGVSQERIEEAGRPKASARVRQLAGQGKKIEAIKLLREETGAGLVAAKQAVERL